MMAGSEETKLHDAMIRMLESSLPQKAMQLYQYLKSRITFTLHDAKKDTQKERVKAYTRDCGDHYEIWLTLDDKDVLDSFIHEIGQVYVFVLGYRGLQPKWSNNPMQAALNNQLAAFARNAFIFYVCEHELEKRDIDRSAIKQRALQHFSNVLNDEVPLLNDTSTCNAFLLVH